MHSKDTPPKVPKGWKAVYDDEYKTYFFVNLETNASQWEEPKGTEWPANPQRPSGPPPPPSYDASQPTRGPVPAQQQKQQQYQQYPPQGFQQYPPQGYQQYPPQGYQQYPPQGYQQYPPQQQQQQLSLIHI